LNAEELAKTEAAWEPLLAAGKIDDEKRAAAHKARSEKSCPGENALIFVSSILPFSSLARLP
jgi:hypothetical protein